MQKRSKVFLTILVLALFITGLFILRFYLMDSYGISADGNLKAKQIYSKKVADGDFKDDQLGNMEREGNVLVVKSGNEKVCGEAPSEVSIGEFSGEEVSLKMEKIKFFDQLPLDNQKPTYYLDSIRKDIDSLSSFDLNPTDIDLGNTENDAFSIVRGSGWLYFELDKRPTPEDTRNAVVGTVTFPEGVSIDQTSFSNIPTGHGVELPFDGEFAHDSLNDEIEIDSQARTVKFSLVTAEENDRFYINYCYTNDNVDRGTVSGRIDLGSRKPVSALKLITQNYSQDRDQLTIEASLSDDKDSWSDFGPENGERILLQNGAISSDICYRYVDYKISLLTDNSQGDKLGLKEIDIDGSDTCLAKNDFSGQVGKVGKLISTGPLFWLLVMIAIIISSLVVIKVGSNES